MSFLNKIKATTNGASAVAVVAAQIEANPDPTWVELATLRTDPDTYLFRERIVPSQVDGLVVMLNDGIELDPVDVFDINGALWLVHGHHRHAAHGKAGRTAIRAKVRRGAAMDALEFAWRANGGHSEQLTEADNLLKVKSILSHKPATSDTEIAGIIGTSVTFVSDCRKKLQATGKIEKPVDADGHEIRMVTRNGKTFPQRVGGIGKKKPAKPTPAIPSANGALQPDGLRTFVIRLTPNQVVALRDALAGAGEIGRVVLSQIGGGS